MSDFDIVEPNLTFARFALNNASLQASFRRAIEHAAELTDDSVRYDFDRDFAGLLLIQDFRISIALRTMQAEHKNANLRLGDIAKVVGLSTSYLNRLFLRETHEGFLGHLRTIRITAAAMLLLSSTLSVKEIAFEVGYNHDSELDRHFKLKHGMAPSLWRKTTLGDLRARHSKRTAERSEKQN